MSATQKYLMILSICMMAISPNLFSEIIIEGVVSDNGAQFLGAGSTPVEKALIELTDEADTTRIFITHTDDQGYYIFRIPETGVDHSASPNPGDFNLLQNYPNPFNPSTVIPFVLSRSAVIHLEIYNILGRKIKTLFNGFQTSGSNRMVWDATDDLGQCVPAGAYICSLTADGIRINRKMLLIDGGQGGSYPASRQPMTDLNKPNKKMSNQFRLRIRRDDIEPYERRFQIKDDKAVIDAVVIRTVTDIDGHRYRAVRIGEQWWTTDNLKVMRYRNGDAIPNVTDNTNWASLTTGAYCDYDNNPSHASTYGHLFNWYAVNDSRNIAPSGWHVPSDGEWQILVDYLGGDGVAGDKMKETGTTHWQSPDTGATNESGFSSLPGGYRDPSGLFTGTHHFEMGQIAIYYSSTEKNINEAWNRYLIWELSGVGYQSSWKGEGYSIRLVKD
jgi:uncharacterized protein (TIGR02145 family)